jgi:hypothetical protein
MGHEVVHGDRVGADRQGGGVITQGVAVARRPEAIPVQRAESIVEPKILRVMPVGFAQHRQGLGHGGVWAVDVEEGIISENLDGRFWDGAVRTAADERAGVSQAKDEQKNTGNAEQIKKDGTAILGAIDRLTKLNEPAVYSRVREAAHLSGPRMTRAVMDLFENGHVEVYEVEIKTGTTMKTKRIAKALSRTVGNVGTDCRDLFAD